MKFRRVWHGYLNKYPMDPDTALARQLNWSKGYKLNLANCSYPEPINLIAASAWHKLPNVERYRHTILYYDSNTKLWVVAITLLDLSVDNLRTWMLEQFSLGAQAVWTNDAVSPARPQPAFSSMDDEPGTMGANSNDPITLTIRLQEMDKFRLGEIDLISFYPEKFEHSEIRIKKLKIYDPDTKKIRREPTEPKLPGQGSGRCKCVYTPMGVYPSISAAAQAHKVSISKMHTLVAGFDQEYGYLDKQEYLARINTIATGE